MKTTVSHKLKIAVLSLSVMGLVSACGAPPSAAPAQNTQKPPTDGKKTVITWLQWWKSEVGDKPLTQIKQEFEKQNPDIELDIQDLPYPQVHDKILTLDAAGTPPDVLTIQVPWYTEFANAKIATPLDDYYNKMSEDFRKNVEGPLWVPWKDKHYGMPFYTGNVALFYNKKKLEAAHVKPPTTWDEFVDVSKKLSDPSKNQFALTGNIGAEPPTTVTYEIWPYILQAGGKLIDNNKAAFNTDEGVKALEFYKRLVKTEKVMTPGELSAGEKEKRGNFSSENTALMFEGPWGIGIQKKANPNLDFDIAPLPKGKTAGTIVAGSVLGIAEKSKNKEAAWKFLAFMGSVKGQMIWAKEANYFPHNKAALQDDYIQKNPQLKVFADQFATNAICPDLYMPQANDLRKIFTTEVQNYLTDKKSAKQALDDAAAQWNKVFDQYK